MASAHQTWHGTHQHRRWRISVTASEERGVTRAKWRISIIDVGGDIGMFQRVAAGVVAARVGVNGGKQWRVSATAVAAAAML